MVLSIDKLDDIVKNTTIHITAQSRWNLKNWWRCKLKNGGHVWILIYKNIFAKGYIDNWSEEAFVIKKVKNTVLWTYFISDLKAAEIVWTFCERIAKDKSNRV